MKKRGEQSSNENKQVAWSADFLTLPLLAATKVGMAPRLLLARAWAEPLMQWYNHEHRHSGIQFVTPAQRHAGLDGAILERRKAV